MSLLLITVPVLLLLAGALLWLVVGAVRGGDFDDLDAPAWRHALDDDAAPELDAVSTSEPPAGDARS